MGRLLATLTIGLAIAAACGGDSGPSDEEYFRRMDEIDKDLDAQFETVCEAEDISAKQCATDFAAVVLGAESSYSDITPPADAKDAHEELVAAIREFRLNLENATDDFSDTDDAFAVFESDAFDPARVDQAFCSIQAIADEKGIEADVGCDEGATTGSDEPTPDGGEETPDPETEAKVAELFDDADTAALVVDEFWALHWSEYFTESYISPTVYGGYFGSENPSCGDIYADGSGNAYYCPADDYIAWDWELFAEQFLDEQIGDSFVYFVIAHEWGHAIQERLDLSLKSIDSELQADCFAAAALTGAVADGTLIFEPGDRGEIFQSLAVVADEVEWGDSIDHGSADERIESYQLGEQGGVNACLPE